MVDLMKARVFRLTKFISNNENVMKTIPETNHYQVKALIVISKKEHLA